MLKCTGRWLPFCVHLQYHVLSPLSFLSGCRYFVEALSLSVTWALPEAFSLSLDLLVSHAPSLPVPQSSLLGPFATPGSAMPLQLPFLWSSISGVDPHYCFSSYLLLVLPDDTCWSLSAFLSPFHDIAISLPGRCFLRFLGFTDQVLEYGRSMVWPYLLVKCVPLVVSKSVWISDPKLEWNTFSED